MPGGIYHIITRGLNRSALFKDHKDRNEFIRRLSKALAQTSCRCYAWALMINHVNLLIRTSEKSLSELMRKILTGYALYFNRRHGRVGYLYQNRYKSILCQEEAYLLELVRYIHLNPVRAGVVKTLLELDKYPWTGHAGLAGGKRKPWQVSEEILARFSADNVKAIKAYRRFVEDGWQMGRREDLTGGGLKRSAGGWSGVQELKKNKEYWQSSEQILGDGNFVEEVMKRAEEEIIKKEKFKRAGWNLDRLAEKVCRLIPVAKEDLFRKGRNNSTSLARSLLAYWAYSELGINGTEIGRYMKITRSGSSKLIRLGERMAAESKLEKPLS